MIKRFIVIVAFFSTLLSSAQENVSSPYSYYGIGLTNFKGTVENRAMGGLSVYSDSIHVNLRNPAAYGKLRLTTYTVGGNHTRTKFKSDNGDDNAKISSLDYLAIGVPLGKFGVGLGLIPYTAVGYRILDINDDVASRLKGRGGMNKVFLSLGYQLTKNFSLGVDADYNFGNFQNTITNIREGIQYGTRDLSRSDIKGFSFNFGLDYEQMILDKLQLQASAIYAPEIDLSTESYRELSTISFTSLGENVVESRRLDAVDADFALPSRLTLGVGLGKPKNWFVGAEYTNLGSSSFLTSFNVQDDDVIYDDANQYRLGGFFIPEYNSITSYFKRVVYRAGLRYEETGLNINNEDISEFGISFGLGLPVGRNLSNLNLGVEYGRRGTTNAGLIQENFLKFSIGLSLNDKWFEKRKFN